MNILHPVHHIRQSSPTNCWHACLQMVLGRSNVPRLGSPDFAPFLRADGTLRDDQANLAAFAARFRLTLYAHQVYSITQLENHVRMVPCIILGQWFRGLHAYVMSGLVGDGTENGTEVYLNNPDHAARDHYGYGFFISEFQRGPFGIMRRG